MTDVEIMSMGGESLDREEIGGGRSGGRGRGGGRGRSGGRGCGGGRGRSGGRGCGRGGDVVEVGDAAEVGTRRRELAEAFNCKYLLRSSIYRYQFNLL